MAKNSYVENLYQAYLKKPEMMKYHCAGIYGLAIYGQIVYVGKSNDILHRMAEHYADVQNPEGKEHKYEILHQASQRNIKYAVWVLYRASSTHDLEKELGERERYYIHKYLPPLNYQIPNKDDYHTFTVQKRAQTITLDELLEEIDFQNRGVEILENKNQEIAKALLAPILPDESAVADMIAKLKGNNFANEWEAETKIHSHYELAYDIGVKMAGAVHHLGMSRILVASVLKGHTDFPNADYVKERSIYLTYALGKKHCFKSDNHIFISQAEVAYQRGFCDGLSSVLAGNINHSGSIKKVLEENPDITNKDFQKMYWKYSF